MDIFCIDLFRLLFCHYYLLRWLCVYVYVCHVKGVIFFWAFLIMHDCFTFCQKWNYNAAYTGVHHRWYICRKFLSTYVVTDDVHWTMLQCHSLSKWTILCDENDDAADTIKHYCLQLMIMMIKLYWCWKHVCSCLTHYIAVYAKMQFFKISVIL